MTSICGGDDGDWDILVTGTSNVVAESADYKYNYKLPAISAVDEMMLNISALVLKVKVCSRQDAQPTCFSKIWILC